MAIAVDAISANGGGSGASSYATSAPSGSGGVLVMGVSQVPTLRTVTTPTGWTQVGSAITDGFSAVRISTYYRVADGTADDTPTVSFSGTANATIFIVRLSGVDTSDVLDVSATGSSTGTASPPIPTVTTTVADAGLLCFLGCDTSISPTTVSTWTYEGGLTNRQNIWSKIATTAGSYGGETATLSSSNQYVARTLAFNPAASGGETVSPGAASATASAVDPTVILGSVSISPGNASATATAVDPTVVMGSITVAPGDATATGAAVDPTVILGSVTVSPGVATATASVVDPTVTGDGISVSPGAASAAASAVAPTVVIGSIVVSPGAASASGAAVDPAVILGSVTVSPGAATATASAVAPSVSAGEAVEIALGVFFVVEFVVQISIDGGTGGQWDEGIKAPALARGFAAPPIRQTLAAPTLLRTDAEG